MMMIIDRQTFNAELAECCDLYQQPRLTHVQTLPSERHPICPRSGVVHAEEGCEESEGSLV